MANFNPVSRAEISAQGSKRNSLEMKVAIT